LTNSGHQPPPGDIRRERRGEQKRGGGEGEDFLPFLSTISVKLLIVLNGPSCHGKGCRRKRKGKERKGGPARGASLFPFRSFAHVFFKLPSHEKENPACAGLPHSPSCFLEPINAH